MGAAFAGAARAPMTAVLIIVEMTGQFSLILPMMLAVVIATGASRFLTRATIYTEKLRRRGAVVRSCANYPGLDAAWYRTAVRTEEENTRLLQIMGEILA